MKLSYLSTEEESGIPGGAVKCVDIGKNTSGEGGSLVWYWHWGAKARGANGIRYPGSPSCKRWPLGVGSIDSFRAGVNTLNGPPGKYGRKVETQRNWRGPAQAVEYVVQFDATRKTSPGFDMLIVMTWKGSDPVFWESAQVLHGCRQLVSWDVGLSPATSATLTLSCHQVMLGTLRGLPVINWRKVGMTSNPHGLYIPGYTRTTMVGTEGCQPARGSQS